MSLDRMYNFKRSLIVFILQWCWKDQPSGQHMLDAIAPFGLRLHKEEVVFVKKIEEGYQDNCWDDLVSDSNIVVDGYPCHNLFQDHKRQKQQTIV